MNYLALLLIALITMAPSAVEAGKGKGKGKGYYPTTPAPVDLCENETIAEKYYFDSAPSIFQLNKTCEDPTCVGQVYNFKSPIFLDKYLHYPAGFIIGHCVVVAEHPAEDSKTRALTEYPVTDEPKPPAYNIYCLVTYKIDYEKELDYYEKYHEKVLCDFQAEVAAQGSSILGDAGTYLITAAAGDFAGAEGSILTTPIEEKPGLFEAVFTV